VTPHRSNPTTIGRAFITHGFRVPFLLPRVSECLLNRDHIVTEVESLKTVRQAERNCLKTWEESRIVAPRSLSSAFVTLTPALSQRERVRVRG